jgi:hypothetical protein
MNIELRWWDDLRIKGKPLEEDRWAKERAKASIGISSDAPFHVQDQEHSLCTPITLAAHNECISIGDVRMSDGETCLASFQDEAVDLPVAVPELLLEMGPSRIDPKPKKVLRR